MTYAEKLIGKANRDRKELSREYGVSENSIVWIGNNRYIIIIDGKEIRI